MATGSRRWQDDDRARRLVGLYVAALFVAVLLTTDELYGVAPGGCPFVCVPGQVYLFGFLGATAYAATSLTFTEKDRDGVVRLGLRALAAFPLAAGVYLLGDFFVEGASGQSALLSGLAFLAGLYVRLALTAFGGLAKRLYGGDGEGRDARMRARAEAERTLERARDRLDGEALPDADRAALAEAVANLEAVLEDWDAGVAEVEAAREAVGDALPRDAG